MAHLLPSVHIKDLRAAIATSCDISPVHTESHTADHTLMREVVHEIDIEPAMHTWVKDCMPVIALALKVRWELVRLEIGELVADPFEIGVRVLEIGCDLGVGVRRRCRATKAWGTWIRVGLTILRSGGAAEATGAERWFTWAGRDRWLWRLWVACENFSTIVLANGIVWLKSGWNFDVPFIPDPCG